MISPIRTEPLCDVLSLPVTSARTAPLKPERRLEWATRPARDFPSLEISSYSMDSKGNISSTLVLDRPEASPNDKNGDLGKPEQPLKEQEPK